MKFEGYTTEGFFDELVNKAGEPRPGAVPLVERIESLSDGELIRRQNAAETALYQEGITFSVYGDEEATERIIPFDVIPRIIEADAWQRVEQRGGSALKH